MATTTTTKKKSRTARAPGMTDDAVKKATGKTWDAWCAVLDRAGAAKKAHAAIAAWLAEEGVPPWWSQMVAVGYERIRGLRSANQASTGDFQVSVSRTLPVPVSKAYLLFAHPKARATWLPKAPLKITTANRDKNLHAAFGDDERVDVGFVARGPARCQVALQHRKLASQAAVAKTRAYWKAAFERLAERA